MGSSRSMKLPSVMKHKFSEIPQAQIQRSSFDRTHGHKTTFDSGYLIPFYIDEVLPGDTFNLNATLAARLATPVVPIMDNLFMDTFYFFVPLRLVWDNFQKFMGEQKNPGDSISFLTPIVPAPATTGFAAQSIYDYFGVRTGVDDFSVCNFWGRAYNLIWNEWFRDQNLQNSAVVDVDDGPDVSTDYPLLKRGKRHDYFTSALPFPQKGPSVPLPLQGDAPVKGLGFDSPFDPTITNITVRETGTTGGVVYPNAILVRDSVTNNTYMKATAASDAYPSVFADLSSVTATTINSLRQAFQLQRLYERDARGGTRYTEILRAHFSVTSPDARLQRPEFLGGNSVPLVVNPVQNQTMIDGDSPLGQFGGNVSVLSRNGFTKSFVEHGVILGLTMVRADLTYQQGTHRMFYRRTKHDFYWPALAHLGEQAVLNQEIFTQGTAADLLTFGYQERFAEYRYKPSIITGKFRSDFATPLDFWHLSQDFSSLPTLSAGFIVEDVPLARVLAVTDTSIFGAQFIFDSYISCKTVRPMPVYSVPGLIDHF